MKERTDNYITTFEFDFVADKDFKMRFVNIIKKTLKNPRGLRVRGRLGKNNPFAYLYRQGGELYRGCAQDIAVEHAKSIDVYYKK